MPLGEEAAVAPLSDYVLTRHRSISECAVEILYDTFHRSLDEIFIHLVESAYQAYRKGVFIPNLKDWTYLSSHFCDKGKIELGIRLAQTMVKMAPEDCLFVTHLAVLFNKIGQPEQSVRVFREVKTKP